MADASLEIRIGANVTGAKKGLNDVEKGLKDLGNTSTKAGKETDSFFTSFAKGFASIAAVGTLTQIGKEIFNVTAEFQKLGVVLANTLGSDQLAKKAFADIEQFAATTPFSVGEVTASFVKLANQGFVPTVKELRNLGDLAASTGKGFDQLAEAILDAQVGEFERLKEFGVRAQDAGDKVIFTFKGISTTVNKTSDAIRGYLTGLGELQGVSGATVKISETLSGKVSNLGDSFDRLFVTIGNLGSGFMNDFITGISNGVDAVTEFIKELDVIDKYSLKKNDPKAFAFTSSLFSKNDSELAAENIRAFQKALTTNIDGTVKAFKKGSDAGKDYLELVDGLLNQALAGAKSRKIEGEFTAIADAYRDFTATVNAQLGQKGVKPVPVVIPVDDKAAKESIAEQIALLKTEQLLVDETTLTYKRLESRIVLLQGQYNALGKAANQAAFELANAAKQSELLTRNPNANIPTALQDEGTKGILTIDTTKALAGFTELKTQLTELKPFEGIKTQLIDFGLFAQAIGTSIANAFVNAFDAIAEGENVFKALGEAVKAVVKQLIAAVIQAIILKAVMSVIGGGSGAVAGAVAGAIGGVKAGGLAGAGQPQFELATKVSGQDLLFVLQRTNNLNGING